MDEKTNWTALRNQAAVAAMQGLLSNASLVDPAWDFRVNVEKTAVALADALIAELRKEKKAEWSEEDKLFLSICKDALWKFQSSDKWDARIIGNWLEEKLKQ